MRSRTRRVALGAIGAAVALASQPLTAANAATTDGSPAPACWSDVTTGESLCVGADEDLVAAVLRTHNVRLDVPDGAIIGGRPVQSLSTASTADSSASLSPDTALTSTVISIVYADTNYGGSSYVMSESQSTSGCLYGAWGFTSMPSGWDNRVSSFRSYANCRTAIFQNTNYGGAQYGYYSSASSVGVMNDQASSWRASNQ